MPTQSDLNRRRGQPSSGGMMRPTVQKTPQQLREEEIFRAETRRLAKQAEMPQLAAYQGIESLPGGGQLTARTVTGEEIQRQMEQSPWLKMAMEKQQAEQAQLMDQAARQQQGALAGAQSSLAMKGGLRGGAAERMAASGAENLTNLMQQQRQAGAIERGQLGMQGADLASRMAQFNVGQQTGTDVGNLQTRLADLANRERRKLFEYGEGMKGYAAEKTAQGYEGGGSQGLFGNLFSGLFGG